MAKCENFKIILKNCADGEVKVTKFEYKDGSKWRTEHMFGIDGHQKIEKDHKISFTRNLRGIGDERTKFRVTYKHRYGGTLWGSKTIKTTGGFTAHDNGHEEVRLTS